MKPLLPLLSLLAAGLILSSCHKESIDQLRPQTAVHSPAIEPTSKQSIISLRPKPLGPLDTVITKSTVTK